MWVLILLVLTIDGRVVATDTIPAIDVETCNVWGDAFMRGAPEGVLLTYHCVDLEVLATGGFGAS